MALTSRVRVEEEKQKQMPKAKYTEQPSSYKVIHKTTVTEPRPAG